MSLPKHVDLVHFVHTDFGFTDHPAVCRDLHRRYIDIAIDAALATHDWPEAARFHWTAETTVAVDDWWQSASPERREDFLKAVDSGQLDIAAIAMNNTPFMNRQQWHKLLHWLPEELWQRVQPKVAIQDDVNGFPRAGALELLDRGVHRVFTGINEDSGGPPFQRPSAFWWKMPDGRRLFIYLSYSYPTGYWFFEPIEWRHGPVPHAGDTRYRPPRPGDYMAGDDASVRKAHAHLLTKLRTLESEGFSYPSLLLSITNQWRIDNDPPFPALAAFVAAWNRLGLEPTLRLTSVAEAMRRLEAEVGDRVPEHQGEWTDFWANGTASAPREVAASRVAKRWLEAAESPLWGQMTPNASRAADEILKDLCLFDEHTWGSINSVAMPYGLDAQSQFTEKAAMAYRPMGRSEWLLSQRVRCRMATEPEGLYVANTAPLAWSGWVRMLTTALRDNYLSLEDATSAAKSKLYFEKGLRPYTPPQNPDELTRENTAATFPDNCDRMMVKFWVEGLSGQSIRKLQLSTNDAADDAASPSPDLAVDAQGWPTGITWPGMTKPLFLPGMGDFVAVRVTGFAPRWTARKLYELTGDEQAKLRSQSLEETTAAAEGASTIEDNPHTIVYRQFLRHPRLLWAFRQLEVWKNEPRARLTVRFNRISCEHPEVFFIVSPLPCESTNPQTSCGGHPFTPYFDQVPGSCRDYFGIDGWVHYTTPAGHWVWMSHDAPLVTFGSPQVRAKRSDAPQNLNRVLSMIFDNCWFTNFVGDSHGVMEFKYDLTWRKDLPASVTVDDLARTMASEPQVIINPGLAEDPILLKRLYEP